MCLSIDALVMSYDMFKSLSCAVPMIICNISISDISFFQFAGKNIKISKFVYGSRSDYFVPFQFGPTHSSEPRPYSFTIGLD